MSSNAKVGYNQMWGKDIIGMSLQGQAMSHCDTSTCGHVCTGVGKTRVCYHNEAHMCMSAVEQAKHFIAL